MEGGRRRVSERAGPREGADRRRHITHDGLLQAHAVVRGLVRNLPHLEPVFAHAVRGVQFGVQSEDNLPALSYPQPP
jgi:hypothetical protein